ncbi:MAG: hypothetical protein ACM3Q2_09785 [Syntrophothermus sp.]
MSDIIDIKIDPEVINLQISPDLDVINISSVEDSINVEVEDIVYIGIKGDKGDKGEPGYTPVKGADYFDGEKGDKGDKGDSGEAPPDVVRNANTSADNAIVRFDGITGKLVKDSKAYLLDMGALGICEIPANDLLHMRRQDAFDYVGLYYLGVLYDYTQEARLTAGTAFIIGPHITGDEYLWIGKNEKFNNVYVDISTAGSNVPYVWEYSLGNGNWGTLAVTDGTNNFTLDGDVFFTPPDDWAIDTVNGYTGFLIRVHSTTSSPSTHPTAYTITPGTIIPVKIYANKGDTVATLCIFRKGAVGIGNESQTTQSSYKLYVVGSLYCSSLSTGAAAGSSFTGSTNSNGQNHNIALHCSTSSSGSYTNASQPSNNSPVARFSGAAFNGSVGKINAMDIYLNPDSEAITRGRLAFKNATVNGYADATELMNLNTDGTLTVLGMAQPRDSVFDSVMHYVGGVYTDDTLLVQSLGNITADVLDVVGNFLYVGKSKKYTSIYFDFYTIMSAGTNRTWEYWNGSAWTALPVTDGTNNWQKDGLVTFNPPSDWAKNVVNSVGPIYFIRVGTASGTFGVEPTLRYCLPVPIKEVFANGDFDTSDYWETAGDWAYSVADYTYTLSAGSGTIRQSAANFVRRVKPNTWYRFRYIVGVAGPAGTVAWIGEEFAEGKTYFSPSTTEVDVFVKTNSSPGDFVIYTIATASGFRLDAVSLVEMTEGNIIASGVIVGRHVSKVNIIDNSSITPAADEAELFSILAKSNLAINKPSGNACDSQKLILRIKDDGLARLITWDPVYRPIAVMLPMTTVSNKVLYITCYYNVIDSKWDILAVNQE